MDTVRHFSRLVNVNEVRYHKLAMFDLDNTIIKTKSGGRFLTDAHDWEFKYPEVRPKLKELHENGYSIIIISNQAKFSRIIEEEINLAMHQLDFPVEVFVATERNKYRKPETGILEDFIYPKIVNLTSVFYVGDAAGRKDDFSDSDRKFAYNIFLFLKYKDIYHKASFSTPEEFFLDQPRAEKTWRGITPGDYLKKNGNVMPTLPAGQKLVILVGYPASGKSTLSKALATREEKIEVVNQDKCRTKTSCIQFLCRALESGQSVIVDRTNPSISDRAEFIQLAKLTNPNIKVLAIVMGWNRALCEHLNIVRERDTGEPRVPAIVYNIFDKKYQEPMPDEGFDQIINYTPVMKITSRLKLMHYMQRTESG